MSESGAPKQRETPVTPPGEGSASEARARELSAVDRERVVNLGKEYRAAFEADDFETAQKLLAKIKRIVAPESLTKKERIEEMCEELVHQYEALFGKLDIKPTNMSEDAWLDYNARRSALLATFMEKAPSLLDERKEGEIPFVLVQKGFIGENDAKKLKAVDLMEEVMVDLTPSEMRRLKTDRGKLKLPVGVDAYVMFNIEIGEDTKGLDPVEAAAAMERDGRSPLTMDEGAMLALFHSEFVRNDGIWLQGTRSSDRVVLLSRKFGKPHLSCGNPQFSMPTWGSASCRHRI
jgi:hypothetical protein